MFHYGLKFVNDLLRCENGWICDCWCYTFQMHSTEWENWWCKHVWMKWYCVMGLILERTFQALHGTGVGGVAVSIVAFQAVDPGSTPGRRMYFFLRLCTCQVRSCVFSSRCSWEKNWLEARAGVWKSIHIVLVAVNDCCVKNAKNGSWMKCNCIH